MEAGLALNKLVGEVVFGWSGIGHYGPPIDGSEWEHLKSVRYDSYEEAYQAYSVYYDARPPADNYGQATPDEMHYDQCYWKDGWGPLLMPDFSADEKSWRNKEDDSGAVYDAWLVVNRMLQRGYAPLIGWRTVRDVWVAIFEPIDISVRGYGYYYHKSISMAICCAALVTFGINVDAMP